MAFMPTVGRVASHDPRRGSGTRWAPRRVPTAQWREQQRIASLGQKSRDSNHAIWLRVINRAKTALGAELGIRPELVYSALSHGEDARGAHTGEVNRVRDLISKEFAARSAKAGGARAYAFPFAKIDEANLLRARQEVRREDIEMAARVAVEAIDDEAETWEEKRTQREKEQLVGAVVSRLEEQMPEVREPNGMGRWDNDEEVEAHIPAIPALRTIMAEQKAAAEAKATPQKPGATQKARRRGEGGVRRNPGARERKRKAAQAARLTAPRAMQGFVATQERSIVAVSHEAVVEATGEGEPNVEVPMLRAIREPLPDSDSEDDIIIIRPRKPAVVTSAEVEVQTEPVEEPRERVVYVHEQPETWPQYLMRHVTVLALVCVFCGFVDQVVSAVRWLWKQRIAAPAQMTVDPEVVKTASRVAAHALNPAVGSYTEDEVTKSLATAAVAVIQRCPHVNAQVAAQVVSEKHEQVVRATDELREYANRSLRARRPRFSVRWWLVLAFLLVVSTCTWWVSAMYQPTGARMDPWTLVAWFAPRFVFWQNRVAPIQTLRTAKSGGYVDPEMFVKPGETGAYRLDADTTATMCLGHGDESQLGPHCEVKSVDKGDVCAAPVSKGATLLGWTTTVVHVLRKCACNAHNALCNRHGSKQPIVLRDICEVVGDFIGACEEAVPKYETHPMRNPETWRAKWPLGKQVATLKSISEDAIEPGKVKVMVKREVYHKRPKRARLIQFYPNLATQAHYAPEFYTLQKVLCECFNNRKVSDNIDVTFASGMNPDELSGWMKRVVRDGAVNFYERDGKNWDSTMGPSHERFRYLLYSAFDEGLARFARSCVAVDGFGLFPGGPFRYRVDGTVKSGHNDTTLGNSLVNAAIAYAAFSRVNARCSILVAGDDLLVAAYEPINCEQMMNLESQYGIVPEARVFEDFEHTTFVSGRWICDGADIKFAPLLGRLFERLWWTTKPPSRRKLLAFRRGVARGLTGVLGTLPIGRHLVRSFDTQGDALTVDKGFLYQKSAYVFQPGVYDWFFRQYGIANHEIATCEMFLASLPAEPLLLVHPVLDRIVAHDTSDIAERGRGVWRDVEPTAPRVEVPIDDDRLRAYREIMAGEQLERAKARLERCRVNPGRLGCAPLRTAHARALIDSVPAPVATNA